MRRFLIVFLGVLLVVNIVLIFRSSREEKPAKLEVKVEEIKRAPLVALVLDDFGYTKKNLEAIKAIGVPVTMAVLPNIAQSEAVCSFARDNGMEVILHLPMEPEVDKGSLEKDTIMVGLDDQAVRDILEKDLASVYSARGVSNHMGSKATSDRRVMGVIFEELKERDLFFLDSMTTNGSVGRDLAQELGIPYVRRDVFIDHQNESDHIKKQLAKVEKMALLEGSVVAIGHDRGTTVEVLAQVIPQMKEKGIEFVKLSEVIERQEGK